MTVLHIKQLMGENISLLIQVAMTKESLLLIKNSQWWSCRADWWVLPTWIGKCKEELHTKQEERSVLICNSPWPCWGLEAAGKGRDHGENAERWERVAASEHQGEADVFTLPLHWAPCRADAEQHNVDLELVKIGAQVRPFPVMNRRLYERVIQGTNFSERSASLCFP